MLSISHRSVAGVRVAAFALCGVFALSAPAAATPAVTAWSTYLHVAPGDASRVVDELPHDTALDLRSCAGRWCQVQVGPTLGYIDRDALALPRPAPGAAAAAPSQACFATGQVSYRGLDLTRFCGPSGAGAR